MKAKTDMRSILVGTVLCAVLVFAVLAVGCFGGDEGDSTTTSTPGDSAGTLVTAVVGTTIVADVNALSSFNSKDPFIPQAQATTTTAAPVTSAAPTTSSTTTTTAAPTTTSSTTTTTEAMVLLVLGITDDDTVSFQLAGITFYGVMVDSHYAGPWGSILVDEIDYDVAEPANSTVTFVLNSDEVTLEIGEPYIL